MKRKFTNSGQSLFEVVIALAVITVILVSLVTLASLSIRNSTFSQNKTRATRISQETLEWLRGERDNDWRVFITRAATPVWCMPELAWDTQGSCSGNLSNKVPGTIMYREVSFTLVPPIPPSVEANTVLALVRVYWEDAQGSHESRTSTNFTNWKNQ